MRLIDANVFIYAAGDEHPYKGPCLRLLDMVRQGVFQANTDIEVLQEILHFYRRRRRVDLAVEVVSNTLALFPDPLPITVSVVARASEVLRRHPELQARDAVHVAVLITEDLEGIISADRGFDAITGVTRFDPMEL